MSERVILFGAGTLARIADWHFTRSGAFQVVAFCADPPGVTGPEFCGRPLVTFDEARRRYPCDEFAMFVAVGYGGMNRPRAEVYGRARDAGYRLVSYVSSSSTYMSDHAPGDNCLIMEANVVQPFARIGSNVVLWSNNVIGHDAVLEDHVFVTSNAAVAGRTRVGTRSFLGVGSFVGPDLSLGEATLIGAGAIVLESTAPRSVYLGPQAVKARQSSDVIQP